ncbi:reverse transcriptase [Gossypium australe]|uniref:Reverse transcriptase n=1 Tax=Gossypium australe TaxID=47621 RepID=A0A5B6W150_9ROSI|nr:reverse transcriptase [Gossypium australe]
MRSLLNRFYKLYQFTNWDALCKPKSVGGLGFKNLVFFNKALLAKQISRLLSQPSCPLAKILKARYYPFSDILSAKIGPYPYARDLIADGILWRIGNGASLPRAGNNRVLVQNINPNWTTAKSEDMLVWKHEGTGEYSVKSEYRVLVAELLQNSNYTSSNRLFNNFLSHSCNLFQRTLRVEVNCPLCKAALEDSDHLLWSCGILQQIWASLQIKIAPDDCISSCKIRFVTTFSIADYQNRQLIAISIWALWYRRNNLSQENLGVSYRSLSTELWNPPVIGFIKINFDATFQIDSRTSTTTVLASDSEGEVVGAETYLFEDVVDAFVAEARAYERAILFAIKMGFRRLLVEGDSPSIIKKLKTKGEDRSILRPIIQHIRILENSFGNVSYLFVPRLVNAVAHSLALEGRKR